MIRFNKPFLFGPELEYVKQAIDEGRISGNGKYTSKCHAFFEERFPSSKCLLTTSCTDALEMAAILLNIQEGDEVIVPSFTFVSSANAFVLRGAKIVFADSEQDHPNLDASKLSELINERTKAIVVVHYGGAACDMDSIMGLAKEHNIAVIEDAAQAIDATFKGVPLGTIGHLGTYSFHETKNVVSGEGGMLIVNSDIYKDRSEVIWEKGTNRTAFYRGEVDKYGWVDVGSSFLPSDLIAAYLFGQLEYLNEITSRRVAIWNQYYEGLLALENEGIVRLPRLPAYADNNGHVFYLECKSLEERSAFIEFMKQRGVGVVFHYLSLHKSLFFTNQHDGRLLPNSVRYSDTLVRLPLHLHLTKTEVQHVIDSTQEFYNQRSKESR